MGEGACNACINLNANMAADLHDPCMMRVASACNYAPAARTLACAAFAACEHVHICAHAGCATRVHIRDCSCERAMRVRIYTCEYIRIQSGVSRIFGLRRSIHVPKGVWRTDCL